MKKTFFKIRNIRIETILGNFEFHIRYKNLCHEFEVPFIHFIHSYSFVQFQLYNFFYLKCQLHLTYKHLYIFIPLKFSFGVFDFVFIDSSFFVVVHEIFCHKSQR